MRKLLIFSMLVALIASFGTSAQANLIVNGSFEELPAPLASGYWTTYTSIAGWTASTGSIEVRNNVSPDGHL